MKHSELINLLNQQLNREVSTFLRYMLEAASIKGAEDEIVRTMYLRRVGEEVKHAQYLANQIVALDGAPALKPDLSFPSATMRERLRRDAAEAQLDVKYCLRLASEAEKEMLVALRAKMEERAAEEKAHAYEMDCLLW